MWEARALYGGARQLAEEINRPDIMASASQNLSFEIALDDPRLAVDLQRQDVELARQLGQRTLEITTLGNLAEDARRTGDWDWVLDELNAVLTLHPEGNDTIPLRLARQVLPGIEASRTRQRSAALARALEEISDPMSDRLPGHPSGHRLCRRPLGGGRGDLAAVAGASDLNQPYVCPAQVTRSSWQETTPAPKERSSGCAPLARAAGPLMQTGPPLRRASPRCVAMRPGRWPGTARPWPRGAASVCRGTRPSRPSRR